jgi:hypothetical protein
MQKTEVFDINNFLGPVWMILAILGPMKWCQFFFRLIFWPKNDWGHALGKIWG